MTAKPTDFVNVRSLYEELRVTRDQVKPLWDDIGSFVGINTNTEYPYTRGRENKSDQLDNQVDDPTAAISVNQAGDYMTGIMWGTGDGVVRVKPSRYVTELVDAETIKEYYDFVSDQFSYHMNHSDAGYQTALRPYAYDQFAFGTSGIGIFPNKAFLEGVEDNALVCRSYGVDNIVIDTGKSGQVEYVFATYYWRVNRIIGEFCMEGGVLDEEKFAEMPKAIQEAYKKNTINDRFEIVFGMMPRADYSPKYAGKRGTRYRGVWFCPDSNMQGNNKFFLEEGFKERPINIARMIVVRGDAWGRASGTMLMSSIRAVNYMVGTSIEVIEKMADPALGIFSNAVFGDDVLDTSPTGLTVFNNTLAGGQDPTFKLYDVGDPSAIINFLVPYLNEKITTAFKVDALLDFASEKEMTATESMQRYVIRGQSLSGILTQQKNERLVPDSRRGLSVLLGMGLLGTDPNTDAARAQELRGNNRGERVIPDAVLQAMEAGKPWFELEFNNELEKLTRTERVQNLLQLFNIIASVAQVYPEIVSAIDWYEYVSDAVRDLNIGGKVFLTKSKFNDALQQMVEQRQAESAMMQQQAAASTAKDATQAGKNQAQATDNA